MEHKTKNAKEAVLKGLVMGWTAKETAFNTGFSIRHIQNEASRLKVAFPWSRIGSTPKHGGQRIPFKTILNRERRTLTEVGTMLLKAIRGMETSDPKTLELMRVQTYLRSRRVQPSIYKATLDGLDKN